MTHPDLDIAIVGAGAAGLMAAIFAGRQMRHPQAGRSTAPAGPRDLRIAALDGAEKIGAKILISGGGRCNVTHDVVTPADFNGGTRAQVARVLRTFGVAETVRFFEELGVTLKREETGKLFPISDEARTVLDALLRAVADAGAELLTNHRVTAIRQTDDGFRLSVSSGGDPAEICAHCVILAAGGLSLPRTGSDGGGYELARSLGHTITTTTPALVPLMLPAGHWLTKLSGVSIEAVLTLASPAGKVLHRQAGAVLFTHFGLSGPAVMDISRHWIAAHQSDASATLSANLLGGMEFATVEQRLLEEASKRPRAGVARVLGDWLPQRLAEALVRQATEIAPATPMSQLSREQRRAVIHALTALPLPVVRDRGYLFAEATAGGVPLEEINLATMASRRAPGLYLCGEMLDIDGRIGGYNFQWAWCTGRLAGSTAARACVGDRKS